MLFVEQGPDLNMCSCVDYALFLGSLKNVVNVQVPSDFDVGASEHGASGSNSSPRHTVVELTIGLVATIC